MSKNIVLSMLLTLTISGGSLIAGPFDAEISHVSWEKAADYYGQRCVVYGTVVAAKNIGSRCFLNFHENFRENFTA